MNKFSVLLMSILLAAGCDTSQSGEKAASESNKPAASVSVAETAQSSVEPAAAEAAAASASSQEPAADVTEDYPQYPESQVEMSLKQVSEHTWFAQGVDGIATDNDGFISNAGVIIGDKGIVVVDGLGTPSLGQHLMKLVRQQSDKPLLAVIATHYHADHIYGLQVFEERGARVYAPAGVEKYLRSDVAQERLDERRFSLEPYVNENTRLVEPDVYVDKTTHIDLGNISVQMNYLGAAHSDADLSVYVPEDKVLFSGDIIFEGRTPFVGDADTKEWLAVLEEMEQQNLKALVPGHGAMSQKPTEVVSLMRKYLAYLRDNMRAGVEEMSTFQETYDAIDWSEFSHLPAFSVANRINAYQVFLSMEAEMLEE